MASESYEYAMEHGFDTPRSEPETKRDVFQAARLVRARPGDFVVFSGVGHDAHDAVLKWAEEHLPEGVRCLVFEDQVNLDVIRPRP